MKMFKMNMNRATACSAAVLIAVLGASPVHAQTTLTKEQLLKQLQNKAEPKTLSKQRLRKKQLNRIVVEEAVKGGATDQGTRTELADAVRDAGLASADLTVYFDYDSSNVKPAAIRTLIPLGQALTDAQLADKTFLIGGHTDAKGSNVYNQRLSQRRAEAVKTFLVSTFKIEPARLVAVGFGEDELKDKYNPGAAENRRVQIVNLTQ